MIDNRFVGLESTVVIEAALQPREQSTERRRAIALVRRALRLEVVDANLGRLVEVPARLGEQRLDVAARASRAAGEDLLACFGRAWIKAAGRRTRRIERELVELQRRQLRRDEIVFRAH